MTRLTRAFRGPAEENELVHGAADSDGDGTQRDHAPWRLLALTLPGILLVKCIR
jgi:hypothetical protein